MPQTSRLVRSFPGGRHRFVDSSHRVRLQRFASNFMTGTNAWLPKGSKLSKLAHNCGRTARDDPPVSCERDVV